MRGATNGMELRREDIPENTIVRFPEKFRKTSSCWVWTAATSEPRPGYRVGMVGWKTPNGMVGHTAPRVSYAIAHGVAPAGMVVRKTCRNSLCVKPDHLEAVTHAESMAKIECRTHGGVKMCCCKVKRIRQRIKNGTSDKMIMGNYGISKAQVQAIRLNQSWYDPKYVPVPLVGSRHYAATLTEKKVKKARELRAKGASYWSLANKFGVGFSTMYDAVNKNTWRHVS